MNDDIRARLVSLAVQSEEAAKKYRAESENRKARNMPDSAILWEGLAEKAEKRAKRCREKLEAESEWPFKSIQVVVPSCCGLTVNQRDSQQQSCENRSETKESEG